MIDCVGYTAAHARMLLPFRQGIGSLVFISSKAVYIDGQGRHSNSDEPPEFGAPVTEEQPTMAPSDIDYNSREGYGPNKVAAEHVLLDSGLAVSILRPSRVHGTGAGRPREWMFVKRVLDGRRHLLLARAWTEILLDETAPADLGDHPWNTLPPFILDTCAAQRLGFVPVGSYAETVKAEIDWLIRAVRSGDPAGVLPSPDAWLDERSTKTRSSPF